MNHKTTTPKDSPIDIRTEIEKIVTYEEIMDSSTGELNGSRLIRYWRLPKEKVDELEALFSKAILQARLEELETLNFDGGGNVITWAGDGKARLVKDRIAALKKQQEGKDV